MTAWRCYMTRTMIGPLSAPMAKSLGFSPAGCPYRGSLVCLRCPLAERIAAICDYKCAVAVKGSNGRLLNECEHRGYCPCGHDQTGRLEAWGLAT